MTVAGDSAPLVDAVFRWWDQNIRQLPWREVRDPWAILVSEVMAQQTQVERVVPKWRAFMAQYPTPESVSAGPASDVVRLWDGLGYNRRAVMLHRCAGEVVSRHGGRVPQDLEHLLALSGIGPYTARAILAFAFEEDVAVVDTNVGRVLARVGGSPMRPSEVQTLADSLVRRGSGWRWNQAILDFGATLCTKRKPACSRCPASDVCGWRGEGPDPAVGSASVSGPQSTFEGSDRQGRGRLVSRLRDSPCEIETIAAAMGWHGDDERALRVLDGLITDGLVVVAGRWVRLVE